MDGKKILLEVSHWHKVFNDAPLLWWNKNSLQPLLQRGALLAALISFILHQQWGTSSVKLFAATRWLSWASQNREQGQKTSGWVRGHLMKEKGGESDWKRKGGKSRGGLAAPSGAFVQLAKGPPRAGGNWWHHCVRHDGGRAGPLAAFYHRGNRSTRARCQCVCESMLCSDCLTSL